MTTANGDAAATAKNAETVLDALYGGPRERFVAERNAAARRLAARGQREDAARIKAASKPSVSAWAVNQLWWTHRPRMQALLDAVRHQAHTVRSGGGPAEQAAAGRARRQALTELLTAAAEVLTAGGHASGAGTMRKISTTLEALAAHDLRPGGPVPGRLCADLQPPGFELMSALQSVDLEPGPSADPPSDPRPDPPADPGRAQAQAALATATERRDATRRRARRLARSLDDATARADEAALTAQQAALALEQALAAAEAARQAALAAERESLRLAGLARHERQRVEQTRSTLEGLARQLEQLEQAVHRARRRVDAATPTRP